MIFLPRKILPVVLLSCFLMSSGCSFVNFSANYYAPPENYKLEVQTLLVNLSQQFKFKKSYGINFAVGEDSDRLNGIPAISGQTLILPEDFLKYVYQNYYNDRHKILTGVMVHEISHSEFDLASYPPETHYMTDVAAIKLLGEDSHASIENYYGALVVMKNYWFARKGVGGHALNASWNLANVASMRYLGVGKFRNWFATDLKKRLAMIRKLYGVRRSTAFKRSKRL